MLRRAIRFTPSAELLNLTFGVLTATTINILTTVALSTSAVPPAVSTAGLVLGGSTVCIGLLALVVGEAKREALEQLGPTISRAEREAEFQARLADKAALVLSLEVVAVVLLGLGIALLLV